LRKKKIWLGIIAGLAVILIGWWAWGQFAPRPLGDRLEYLGKRDYGCAWFCDSPPSTTYSYATDMTPPELLEYFPKAQMLDEDDIDHWQDQGNFRIHFFDQNSNMFTISFRTDTAEHIRNFNLKPTTRAYIVEIESNEYQFAKDSL